MAGLVIGGVFARWAPPTTRHAVQEPTPILKTAVDLPASAPLALGSKVASIGYDSPSIARSRDGTYLAYVAKGSQ